MHNAPVSTVALPVIVAVVVAAYLLRRWRRVTGGSADETQ
jgi:hypothetical protein